MQQLPNYFVYLSVMSPKTEILSATEKARRLNSGYVYLINEFEGCVMKHLPGENPYWYCKFKGKPEYQIHHSTALVTDTYLEWVEITEKEYREF